MPEIALRVAYKVLCKRAWLRSAAGYLSPHPHPPQPEGQLSTAGGPKYDFSKIISREIILGDHMATYAKYGGNRCTVRPGSPSARRPHPWLYRKLMSHRSRIHRHFLLSSVNIKTYIGKRRQYGPPHDGPWASDEVSPQHLSCDFCRSFATPCTRNAPRRAAHKP